MEKLRETVLEIGLQDLQTFEKAEIHRIDTKDNTKIRKLTAFGIMPGAIVSVIQKYPAYVVQVGFTQVALDNDIASEIKVIRKV